MSNIAIAYHSGFGHTQALADAIAKGIQSVPGAKATLIPVDQAEARAGELDAADAIVFGDLNDPKSRVSRHESTKGDGKFDKHTVFADGLLIPRMVLPLQDSVLIGETDTNDIWLHRDTNSVALFVIVTGLWRSR